MAQKFKYKILKATVGKPQIGTYDTLKAFDGALLRIAKQGTTLPNTEKKQVGVQILREDGQEQLKALFVVVPPSGQGDRRHTAIAQVEKLKYFFAEPRNKKRANEELKQSWKDINSRIKGLGQTKDHLVAVAEFESQSPAPAPAPAPAPKAKADHLAIIPGESKADRKKRLQNLRKKEERQRKKEAPKTKREALIAVAAKAKTKPPKPKPQLQIGEQYQIEGQIQIKKPANTWPTPPQEKPPEAKQAPPTPKTTEPHQHQGTPHGAATTVLITEAGKTQPKRWPAKYQIREGETLITSHDPFSFQPDPRYPENTQERDYAGDQYEQMKVITNAEHLIPEYMITDNPDLVNGPPVITPDGIVLGGNSRVMTVNRAAKTGQAIKYRTMLKDRAGDFGLKSEGFKNPVLVREIKAAPQEWADLSRRLNESQTQEKDETTDAISMSKRLSDQSLLIMAESVNEDETLNAYLTSPRARPFVASLLNDGVIQQKTGGRYLSGGDLSEAGRGMVTRSLVAKVVPNAVLVERLGPARRETIARVVPALISARSVGHDITPDLQRSIEDLTDMQARGIATPADYDAQGSLFGAKPQASEISITLRDQIFEGPGKFRDTIRAFANKARLNRPDQGGLFGAPPTAGELFKESTPAPQEAPIMETPPEPEPEPTEREKQEKAFMAEITEKQKRDRAQRNQEREAQRVTQLEYYPKLKAQGARGMDQGRWKADLESLKTGDTIKIGTAFNLENNPRLAVYSIDPQLATVGRQTIRNKGKATEATRRRLKLEKYPDEEVWIGIDSNDEVRIQKDSGDFHQGKLQLFYVLREWSEMEDIKPTGPGLWEDRQKRKPEPAPAPEKEPDQMMEEILKQNPIFADPNFNTDVRRWEKIRDAVEKAHPDLDDEQRGPIIGGLMMRTDEPPPKRWLKNEPKKRSGWDHEATLKAMQKEARPFTPTDYPEEDDPRTKEEKEEFLGDNFRTMTNKELGAALGLSHNTIRRKLTELRLRRKK